MSASTSASREMSRRTSMIARSGLRFSMASSRDGTSRTPAATLMSPLGQDAGNSLAHQDAVVGDYRSHGITASTRVGGAPPGKR